ncbi:hypothetical protein A9D12_08125 [Erythrobacter neustonensis]|uniref:Uncharacterized protein n=1 Tax=Erythrobacter neustonensis TaxID=1112 RepID=A0A192D4U9_9SPHN|nr:hypothetical protein A9D12_08125 [Erythrobacter neustonensis]
MFEPWEAKTCGAVALAIDPIITDTFESSARLFHLIARHLITFSEVMILAGQTGDADRLSYGSAITVLRLTIFQTDDIAFA